MLALQTIAIALVVGILIGLFALPAMATPFVPSPPSMGGIKSKLGRVYFTIAMMTLGRAVFLKRGDGSYKLQQAKVSGDDVIVTDGETTHRFTGASNRMLTFGKRPLGLGWTTNHRLFQRARRERAIETDGGSDGTVIDMGKIHRLLRGGNDDGIVESTKSDAKAEYGGGNQGMSTMVMIVAAMMMLLLGFGSVFFAMS